MKIKDIIEIVLDKRCVLFLFCALFYTNVAEAQLLCPINLGFEYGKEGDHVYGWSLGQIAQDSGYIAITTTEYQTQGLSSAKLFTENKEKISVTASFYQRIDAEYYRNKKIRFIADVLVEKAFAQIVIGQDISNRNMYSYSEPCYLFLNARDRLGRPITNQISVGINLVGWNLEQFVELLIPEDAVDISYGISFTDTSTLYLDNCKLEIVSDDYFYYAQPSPLSQVEKLFLTTFTNVAGVIQNFHPSKNSIDANWEKVYLAGVNSAKLLSDELKNVKNNDTLLNRITTAVKDFFVPFCPEIQIDYNNNRSAVEPHLITNKKVFDTTKYLLAFLHKGIPTHRINAPNIKNFSTTIVNLNGSLKNDIAHLMQYITISEGFKPNDDKQISLSAHIKLIAPNNVNYNKNKAIMYLRFEDEMGNFVGFSEIKEIDNEQIKQLQINEDGWAKLELNSDVIDKTTKILIIFEYQGYGALFIDEVECWTSNYETKTKIPLRNSGFDIPIPFDQDNWLTTNETFASGYSISYSDSIKFSGARSVVIYTPDEPPYFITTDSSIINFDALVLNKIDKKFEKGTINCSLPIYVEATSSESVVGDSINVINYQTYPQSNTPILITGKNDDFNLHWSDRDSRLVNAMFLYNTVNHFTENRDSNFIDIDLEPFAICDSKEEYIKLLHNIIGNEKRNKVWSSLETNILREQNVQPVYKAIKGWGRVNDSILYIDLSYYTDKEIFDSFDSLQKFKHWILDLRNDVRVTNYFVGLYADSVYRSSAILVPTNTAPFKTIIQGQPYFELLPPAATKQIEGNVIFLINNNTFGYGELLSATVKEQGKGILIGTPTQGAVIVGKGFRIDDDIFISIGNQYGFTPSGYPIFRNPITPDIEENDIHCLDTAIKYLLKE